MTRTARLADALRANLRRRKAAARGSTADLDPSPAPPPAQPQHLQPALDAPPSAPDDPAGRNPDSA